MTFDFHIYIHRADEYKFNGLIKKVKKMSQALDNLKTQLADQLQAISDEHEQVLTAIGELQTAVADLQALIADGASASELQEAADIVVDNTNAIRGIFEPQ